MNMFARKRLYRIVHYSQYFLFSVFLNCSEQFVPKEIAARPPASKPIHPESLPFEGSTAYREQFGAPELPARVPPALQKFECVPDDRDFGFVDLVAYFVVHPRACLSA
eukprot:GHVU01138841.1.p4 GENE.GHVU01138841.1~~GHVU01138841.1.p4  ORF type:complete len:108 (+),score=5.01 GHVU01138841.1:461-784(+)